MISFESRLDLEEEHEEKINKRAIMSPRVLVIKSKLEKIFKKETKVILCMRKMNRFGTRLKFILNIPELIFLNNVLKLSVNNWLFISFKSLLKNEN